LKDVRQCPTLPSPGAEAKAREGKVRDNLYVGST